MSEINYKEIFKSNSCHDNASPGRMVSFNLENQKGLILQSHQDLITHHLWSLKIAHQFMEKQFL